MHHLKHLIGMILLSLSLAIGASATASAQLCHRALSAGAQLTVKDLISRPKFEENGFKVTAKRDGRYILSALGREADALGELRLVEVPFLFEWKDKTRHDRWVKNKGLSEADLEQHFAKNSNWLERGFCVSTNIIDSSRYGDTLTVFPSQGPMLVFYPLASSASRDLISSVEGTRRLQGAGVDAVSLGKVSWFGVIQSRHLKNPTPISAKAIVTVASDWGEAFSIAMRADETKLQQIRFWQLLPKNHILQRILRAESITYQEKLAIGSLIRQRTFPGSNYSPSAIKKFFYEEAVPAYLESLRPSPDTELQAKIERYLQESKMRESRLE